MPEHESELSNTGLRYWQIMLANQSSEDIPNTNFNIIEEMDKNLVLKADCMGGHPVVITPVTLPPSFKEVWTWCLAKKLYETMKAEKEAMKKKEGNEKVEDKEDTEVNEENSQGKKTSPKFTKIKDQKSVTFDEITIIDPDSDGEGNLTPTTRGRKTSTPKSASRFVSKTPAKSAIKKSKVPSPEPEIIDDDNEHNDSGIISPSPPAKRTRRSQVSTSTPRRRVSFEKEFPACTPIHSSSQRHDVTPSPATPGSSTTPISLKRGRMTPPPATPGTSRARVHTPPMTPTSTQGLGRLSLRLSQRKLSSGMEASLRRLLIASQLKVRFPRLFLSNFRKI